MHGSRTVSKACRLACLLSLAALPGSSAAPGPVTVSLIGDRAAGAPVQHGLEKLKLALQARKIAVEIVPTLQSAHGQFLAVAGLPSKGGAAAELLRASAAPPPTTPESLLVRKMEWKGRPALLLTGGDDTGLMYALLDTAGRVGWAPDASQPFSEVRDITESPAVAERGLTIFTMQQAQFENRLHDAAYWAAYFDMLARDRFNSFQVLFAYEMNGYACPAYPYFVNVDEFPDVRVAGLTREQQARNLADLNRLIAMAHQRGIKVTIGLWCHYYRFDSRWQAVDHAKPVDGLVSGLTPDNLIPYTKAAFTSFLHSVKGIDKMMFLMHSESGLRTEDMKVFWDNFYQVMRAEARDVPFEIRAKGVSDDLVTYAQGLGLNMIVNTKYWAEQVGLPFHPTHVQELNQFDRRHGYSDMLKYPRSYGLHWTLWTSGTTRILPWGDPDYVRRFAATTRLGGARGFDVMEPLATKMAGQPHSEQPFDLLNPRYRYYKYEFERYWHFYELFGRLTYNPDTPPDLWTREFERRFGKAAAPWVEQGLHRASQILPHVVAYCLPAGRFPTTRGWPERQRQEDLPLYAASEPSDIGQFQSLHEAARALLDGTGDARLSPLAVSQWFGNASDDVLKMVAEAERNAGPDPGNEFLTAMADLRILANLALYHSRRIPAGLSYALYQQTGDVGALDDAIASERRAIQAWEGIVRAAGDVYNFNLRMGLPEFDLSGHWRDELVKLNTGLAALERERAAFRPAPRRGTLRYDLSAQGSLPPGNERFKLGKLADSSNLLTLPLPAGRYQVTVSIRDDKKSYGPMWIELNGGVTSDIFPVPAGQTVERTLEASTVNGKLAVLFDNVTSGSWHAGTLTVTRVDPLIAHVPLRRLAPGEDLTVRATVNGVDPIARVRVYYGDKQRGFQAFDVQPGAANLYRSVIPASAAAGEMSYFLEAVDSRGRVSTWPPYGRSGPVPVLVTADREPPAVQFTPVTSAPALTPLRITAEVRDPSGVKWVRLRYRGLTQHQDFQTLAMLPGDKPNQFEAVVPASDVDPKFDFMYFIEAMDNAGNARIYPDLAKETPYIVVEVSRAATGTRD